MLLAPVPDEISQRKGKRHHESELRAKVVVVAELGEYDHRNDDVEQNVHKRILLLFLLFVCGCGSLLVVVAHYIIVFYSMRLFKSEMSPDRSISLCCEANVWNLLSSDLRKDL